MMGFFKWLGAGLVWIVAGVVGLLGVILSITIILLPLGIPLLMLARKLTSLAAAMVMPKAMRDPVGTLGKAVKPKSKRRFGFKRKSKVDRFFDWVLS